MKKALLKDSVKEIKNNYKRFLSILLMAFLGVGFFAGIRAASPDMVDTIDKYYDEQNVYDIQVLSTLGLTNNDIEELSKIENIDKAEGSYETDGKIDIENKEIIVKFIAIGEINAPLLLSGELPQAENECLVEKSFLTANNKQIGDTIQAAIEKTTNDKGDEIKYLKQSELKIVGTVQSPLYISRDRGNSSLGAGKVNYYIYIPKENINATDVYTSVYLQVKDAKQYTTSSDKYEDYIEAVEDKIEEIKEEREQARHDELVSKGNEKLEEAQKELDTNKADAEKQINDAEKEIADGKAKIDDAQKEISKNQQKADMEFANAQKQIDKARTKIEENEATLIKKEEEANNQFAQYESQKQELQKNLTTVNSTLEQVQKQLASITELLKDETLTEIKKQEYEVQKQKLEVQIATLKENKQTIESGILQIEEGISSGKAEIENGKKQIEQAKTELTNQEKTLNSTKKSTYAKIESAKNELEKSKQELEDGEAELSKSKQEFEEKIAGAEKKLQDAKEKILEIETPTWYILDRNSNSGYVGFIQDSDNIANIGKVFPVVFFLVAALISLTSMTRMVEEQRLQIGTLKALGYNTLQIMSKYILYASLASVIGGLTGMCVGFISLPKILWMLYTMMYQMIDISISFKFEIRRNGIITNLCVHYWCDDLCCNKGIITTASSSYETKTT